MPLPGTVFGMSCFVVESICIGGWCLCDTPMEKGGSGMVIFAYGFSQSFSLMLREALL
jgi:hypothetical protein